MCSRAREFTRARICYTIVFVFIMCNLPRLMVGIFEVTR